MVGLRPRDKLAQDSEIGTPPPLKGLNEGAFGNLVPTDEDPAVRVAHTVAFKQELHRLAVVARYAGRAAEQDRIVARCEGRKPQFRAPIRIGARSPHHLRKLL